jgi:alkanesulfonate monooxygenase SsuD/methylene tetrahydromethanopterin reductase-like flavin-dependent oxidoreductase (luciferase family)
MFEEGVEILFKAFAGEPFSHKGKYYTIPPEVPYRGYTLKEITLVPAPERQPVECAAATRARLLHDAQAPPQCGGRG